MKRFAFALLAIMAFAQEDDTVVDDTGADGADADVVEPEEEEVVTSWSSDLVWDTGLEGTGVWEIEQNSAWNKLFKTGDADASAVGIPTSVLAEPNEDGVEWLWVTSKGTWALKWEDKTDKNAKAQVGNMGMSWITGYTGETEEDIVVTSIELTGGACEKSTGTLICDATLTSGTTDGCLEPDWSQTGLDVCPTKEDMAAVTAWTGSVTGTVTDNLITGMSFAADRPWVPTEDRASALTFKNQEPQYMCMQIWLNRDGSTGAVEVQCGTVQIDIPVPEPEEVIEEVVVETGASALYATAIAFAAVATMAF